MGLRFSSSREDNSIKYSINSFIDNLGTSKIFSWMITRPWEFQIFFSPKFLKTWGLTFVLQNFKRYFLKVSIKVWRTSRVALDNFFLLKITRLKGLLKEFKIQFGRPRGLWNIFYNFFYKIIYFLFWKKKNCKRRNFPGTFNNFFLYKIFWKKLQRNYGKNMCKNL